VPAEESGHVPAEPAAAGAGERTGRQSAARGQRTGRRGGDSGTREAILTAARDRFGEVGYDRATIRSIAAAAGVDPALVHHFFGPKDRLFAAAMRLPMVPSDVVDAALAFPGATAMRAGARAPAGKAGAGGGGGGEAVASLGDHVIRTVLGVWDVDEVRSAFLGLLRSAVTSDQAATMLREFATDAILGRIAQVAQDATGDGDGEYRAALAASQMLGLALARYVLRIAPIAQASNEELAAAIGPSLDRYLTGDIRPPTRPPVKTPPPD
jgi:AcrR family transcriptional regulator